MGMVVDGVSGVVSLAPEQIAPIPAANGVERVDYLLGLGHIGARRLILVDIDRLMSIQRGSALPSREVA
jgi:purine-binding chemotaxis protein CheW